MDVVCAGCVCVCVCVAHRKNQLRIYTIYADPIQTRYAEHGYSCMRQRHVACLPIEVYGGGHSRTRV